MVATQPEAVVYGSPTGRAVIAAATLGSGMAMLDGTVVNIALRTIGADLDASLSAAMDHERLPALAGQPDPARRIARRPLRAASGLHRRRGLVRRSPRCSAGWRGPRAFSSRAGAAGRRGALLTPGSLSMIQGAFTPPTGRGRSAPGRGWAGSPPPSGRSSGACSSQCASWRWIFLINVPLAVVTVLVAQRQCPRPSTRARRPGSTSRVRRRRQSPWPA